MSIASCTTTTRTTHCGSPIRPPLLLLHVWAPPLATELCKAAADAGEHLQAAETADETQSHNLTKALEPRGAAEVPSGRESRRQRRPQAYGEGPEPRGSGWFGGR